MALRVLVDWDNDNTFTGAYDDITGDVREIAWSLGMRNRGQRVADESQCEMVLENVDGKYTPENTASPIFGKMLPNRRLKIRWDTGDGSPLDLWSGFLEFPQVMNLDRTTITEVELTGTGTKRRLDTAQLAQSWENVTGDVIIRDALEAAGGVAAVGAIWLLGVAGASELGQTTILGDPGDFYDLDTGVYTFPYYSVANKSAYEVITVITRGERGRFYFDRSGKAVWWNQYHLATKTTLTDAIDAAAGQYAVRDREYVYGDQIVNVVDVEANPRVIQAAETLWEYDGDPLVIGAGETIALQARLRKSSGQFAAAGSLTASPTFSSGTGTVEVTPAGGMADIEISSVAGATLSALTLDGEPEITQHAYTVTRIDSASIGVYGRREESIDLGPVNDYARAEGVANEELRKYAQPFGEITEIKWKQPFDGVANAHQLAWTIGDLLEITDSSIGHSARYFVIGEEHSTADDMVSHVTTLRLEAARLTQLYWVLGVAGYSELGEATYLG